MNKVEVIKANVNLIDRKKSTQIDKRLRVAAYCRVSTDSEDQLNSYRSQVQYYTDLISKKSEWVKVGIYADEGITGTQVNKREDFQRLINDCMRGEIDMIITKSISRFARNTVDTLNYVRKLKENNIAVFFEDENINTLSMDGELLLTVLSSVESKKLKLVDMHLEGVISKEDFENKYQEIILKIEDKQAQITTLKSEEETQNGIYDKIKTCRRLLEENDKLETFDRVIFESIIERVIVDGFDDKGNIDPYMIILILKTGNKVNISLVTGRGRRRKNIDEEVDDSYPLLTHDLDNSCQLDSVNAC